MYHFLARLLPFFGTACAHVSQSTSENLEISQDGDVIDYRYQNSCDSIMMSKKLLYSKITSNLKQLCGGRGYEILSENYSDCVEGQKEVLLKLRCR